MKCVRNLEYSCIVEINYVNCSVEGEILDIVLKIFYLLEEG